MRITKRSESLIVMAVEGAMSDHWTRFVTPELMEAAEQLSMMAVTVGGAPVEVAAQAAMEWVKDNAIAAMAEMN